MRTPIPSSAPSMNGKALRPDSGEPCIWLPLSEPKYQTSLKLFNTRHGVQEQRGHRTIRLRDDPELFCIHDLTTAHQVESVLGAQFVSALSSCQRSPQSPQRCGGS